MGRKKKKIDLLDAEEYIAILKRENVGYENEVIKLRKIQKELLKRIDILEDRVDVLEMELDRR
jgi:hypothetical protein